MKNRESTRIGRLWQKKWIAFIFTGLMLTAAGGCMPETGSDDSNLNLATFAIETATESLTSQNPMNAV